METLLVLPVLIFLAVGLITVLSLVMENYAVGQAANNGVLQWANGAPTTTATATVQRTMAADGYPFPVTTQFSQSGTIATVSVTAPIFLLASEKIGHIVVQRTVASVLPFTGTGGATSGGGGGTIVVLHHFPMW
ncbi:MAG: hypothetical protein M0Z53_14040 [Thermaerobacter sp.]|nr:hypothetical protein [Thermaerobacter sp.]